MAYKLLGSSRFKVRSDLSKSLTSLLECPVCFEFMVTPIIQCLNGHNICSNCRSRLHICPTCRVPLTITSRNVALENIAEACIDGTGENQLIKTPHPSYRVYECLAGKGRGCAWTGRRSDLWNHVTKEHERLAVRLKKDSQVFRVSNHDFSVTGNSSPLISALGQLFWYQFRQDVRQNKWFQAIQYIGPREKALCYKYSLEFGPLPQDTLKRSISYSRVTHSDEEHIESIFKTADCFNIDLNTIKYFVIHDATLQFKVKIEKV